MAFADPQTLTINAVANVLPRVGQGPSNGTFSSADETVRLSFTHQKTGAKRARRVARVDFSKIAADPLTAENAEFNMAAYLTVDVPPRGLSVTEQKQIVDSLLAYLTASTGANVTKLLGGES